jgi:hypothetical protein
VVTSSGGCFARNSARVCALADRGIGGSSIGGSGIGGSGLAKGQAFFETAFAKKLDRLSVWASRLATLSTRLKAQQESKSHTAQ